MADFYTNYAFVLEKVNAKEYNWLRDIHRRLDAAEDIPEWNLMCDGCSLAQWVMRPDVQDIIGDPPTIDDVIANVHFMDDAGAGDLDVIGTVLQQFFEKFRPEEVFGFEFANTCSSHRPGGFSGGAVLITRDTYEIHTGATWLVPVMRNLQQWLNPEGDTNG